MLRLSLVLALVATIASFPHQRPGSATGKTGALQPGDVYRYAFPRSDLDVTVDGTVLARGLRAALDKTNSKGS